MKIRTSVLKDSIKSIRIAEGLLKSINNAIELIENNKFRPVEIGNLLLLGDRD